MVGVPGRSKACHTCRRRKLGCDQLRPWCRQCTRAGLSCGGYGRAPIFVNSTKVDGHDDGSSSFSPRSYSRIQLNFAADQTEVSTRARTTTSPLLDRSLERTAAESKCLFLYWNFLLPNNGQSFTLEASRYSTTGWIQIVQDLSQGDDCVRLGLLVNALALAGQQTGQPFMVAEAWRMYSMALQSLAQLLRHADGREIKTDDKLVMISALLAAFELLQVSEGRRSWLHGMTWLRHSSGQKAIILARGPESFVEGHAHRLFADGRLHLIYPEILNRKRSVFSSPEWKSIPWSRLCKDPKDELVDILLEIPGLLEDLDYSINRCPENLQQRSSLHEQLQTRCRSYEAQLRSWSTNSGATAVNFAETQISHETPQSSTSSANDFAMAHLGMIYWATCSLLYKIMRDFAGAVDDRTDPGLYCHKILLMVPFFQRPGMGAIFINFVGFPVGVVVSFLARQVESVGTRTLSKELRRLLQRIFRNQHHGRQLRAFLETWPWQTAGEAQVVMGRTKARDK